MKNTAASRRRAMARAVGKLHVFATAGGNWWLVRSLDSRAINERFTSREEAVLFAKRVSPTGLRGVIIHGAGRWDRGDEP